jgi:alpha-glucosidase
MAVTAADDALLVFTRSIAGQRLTCAFNLGNAARPWHPEVSDRFRVIAAVNGAAPGDLPAYSGMVLEQLD